MPRIWYFHSHDDFEEACYKLGIPWVPPAIINNSSIYFKQLWLRKVLMGKIKIYKYRQRDKRFLDRYKECIKEATVVNGAIDPDSLPPDVRAYYFEKKRRADFHRRHGKLIREMDVKIYLHKWYPWSYNYKGEPAVVLQGFYSLKAARQRFLIYYGRENLRSVHWIKGKTALEKKFVIGKSLLIGGKRKKPISKILLTEAYRNAKSSAQRTLGERLARKKRLSSQQKEKYFINLVEKFNYGAKEYRTLLKAVPEKLVKLSKAKETESKERKLFTKKSDLGWGQIKVALAYKSITKRSTISSIRWTKRHWDEYKKAVSQRLGDMPQVRRLLKEEFILKELLIQGFVPMSEFPMKMKTGWYAYLVTNRKVCGDYYIYPEHFAHDYRAYKKGYMDIHIALNSGIGQEGYTRIYYTAYKNGIAK